MKTKSIFTIRSLTSSDLPAVQQFTDKTIGANYFSKTDLEEVLKKSQKNNIMCSFILVDDNNNIHGVRFTYAPGMWTKGKSHHLRPDLWRTSQETVGYFQSLFIAEEARGKQWGPRLSYKSVETLKKLGATAIVTHAWKESPESSSLRYLKKFGFKEVATHPYYWKDVDYVCTLDGKPCMCTAIEMVCYL